MRTYRLELVCESGTDEPEETILRTSTDVARALRPLFKGIDREKFAVVLLDAKHRLIGVNTVSIGSLTASIAHPRLCCAQHKRG
jgi:DNA repair protein RadC